MATEKDSQKPSAREAVPVIIVEDRDQAASPPLRLYAFLIFFGTLLGSLIGAVADLSAAAETIASIDEVLNPPVQLCIAGSDTILGSELQMATQWQAAYEAEQQVKVTIEAIGSSNGVRRAIEGGCVHVLAMSEALTPEQIADLEAAGIEVECAATIGYDVIAFVTDINNQLPTLQQRQLSAILNGRIKNWSEIPGGEDQPIFILARPGSGTTAHILRQVAFYEGEDSFPADANYLLCLSNETCLDQTLATPGSLYWVSTAWMRTKPPRYLRVLPILPGDERPIDPLTSDFNLAEYPKALIRPLYMYVLAGEQINSEGTTQAREFLKYVRSVKGQEILEQAKFITYFDHTADIPITLPPGFTLTDGPQQICRTA